MIVFTGFCLLLVCHGYIITTLSAPIHRSMSKDSQSDTFDTVVVAVWRDALHPHSMTQSNTSSSNVVSLSDDVLVIVPTFYLRHGTHQGAHVIAGMEIQHLVHRAMY